MAPKPYVVLLGDVGTGKSTIVEKLTGETGRSSASNKSVTVTTEVFEIYDGSFVICDTPGSNAMENQFKHNLNIAHAINYSPVTCVMIIAKADTRMDNVVDRVKNYAEGFLPEDLPLELIGVCVTHMDTVTWTKNEILPYLKGQLGIETAIVCSLDTTGTTLKNDILAECAQKRPIELHIDSEMFLRLFKISNNNLKVLREARKEVARFEKMKQLFYQQKREYGKKDQMDMIFEFQTWMLEEIIEAQKRLSNNNNFTFLEGPEMASEAGHVANMTNQLRKVLSDVRIEAMTYHKDVDTDFRKCPHCSTVWQKIEGCDGATTCGKRVSKGYQYDVWSGGYGVMSTFEFSWDYEKNQFIIKKLSSSEKKRLNTSRQQGRGAGCGKDIEWAKMAPVKVPVEFGISPSSTKDVVPLPPVEREPWNEYYVIAISLLPELKLKKNITTSTSWNAAYEKAIRRLGKLKKEKKI